MRILKVSCLLVPIYIWKFVWFDCVPPLQLYHLKDINNLVNARNSKCAHEMTMRKSHKRHEKLWSHLIHDDQFDVPFGDQTTVIWLKKTGPSHTNYPPASCGEAWAVPQVAVTPHPSSTPIVDVNHMKDPLLLTIFTDNSDINFAVSEISEDESILLEELQHNLLW